jgi:guanosine-3',5'-bis(diphosphate) 3'-pyrophosphohydrolase
VKLADKIANLQDLADSPPATWSLQRKQEYVDWSEAVVNQLRGTNAKLEAHFDSMCQEVRERLRD